MSSAGVAPGRREPATPRYHAYRQPIARSGIELVRGSASDSAIDTLLDRALITRNAHQPFVTTRGFLDYVGFRDLADLPALGAANAPGSRKMAACLSVISRSFSGSVGS